MVGKHTRDPYKILKWFMNFFIVFGNYLRFIWKKYKNEKRNTVGKSIRCVCQTCFLQKIIGLKIVLGLYLANTP